MLTFLLFVGSATCASAAEASTVTVLGAVRDPGKVVVPTNARLSFALARAGISLSDPHHFNPGSDLHDVRITHAARARGSVSADIDFIRSLDERDRRFDPILLPGDVIFVPASRSNLGKVISRQPHVHF